MALLGFIGQSFAVGGDHHHTDTKQIALHTEDGSMHHAHMNHDSLNKNSMNHDHMHHEPSDELNKNNPGKDCCEQQCECDMVHCSLVFVTNSVHLPALFHSAEKFLTLKSHLTHAFPPSLFRPPNTQRA